MSYAVTRGTREIGLRMALGAPAGQVFRMFLGKALALAGLGTGLGLAAALALSRTLESLVFGVSTTDPATFLGLGVLLLATSAAACAAPAWRAARTDPVVTLRVS